MEKKDPQYKLLLYCPNKNGCRCFRELVEDQFKISVTPESSTFNKGIRELKADAAVVCLTASERNLDEFQKAESYAGFLPVLSCTPKLESGFVSEAVDKGVKRFISGDMKTEDISALIINAIKQNDLRNFIEKKFPGCFERSIYAKKIIDFVIKTFPQRINEEELAKELNISIRWFQKGCKKAFGITYNNLLRIIWVYQTVRLLEKTNFDNTYLAMQLNYKELSSMDRDFRKVLNLSPNGARKKLAKFTPNQLFEI